MRRNPRLYRLLSFYSVLLVVLCLTGLAYSEQQLDYMDEEDIARMEGGEQGVSIYHLKNDKTASERADAAKELGENVCDKSSDYDAATSISALKDAASDNSSTVRKAILDAFESIASCKIVKGKLRAKAIDGILDFSDDTRLSVKRAVLDSMLGFTDYAMLSTLPDSASESVIQFLRDFLEGWHSRKKEIIQAIGTAKELGVSAVEDMISLLKYKKYYRVCVDALESIGLDGQDLLIGALDHSNGRVRKGVREVLKTFLDTSKGVKAIVPELISVLEEGLGRESDIVQLISNAKPPILPYFRAVLGRNDQDPDLAYHILSILLNISESLVPARPFVIRSFTSPESKVRGRAAQVLKEMDEFAAPAFPLLVHSLWDSSKTVRLSAHKTLINFWTLRSRKSLKKVFTDPRWRVRRNAGYFARKLGPKAQYTLPYLAKLVYDDNRYVRKHAITSLGMLGSMGMPILLKALKASKSPVRSLTAKAIGYSPDPISRRVRKALYRATGDSSWSVRRNAIRSFGRLGLTHLPILLKLLKSRRSDVRKEATYAIGSLKSKAASAVPALIKSLKDRKWRVSLGAIKALRQIGPQAASSVNALLPFLKSRSWYIRAQAIETIGSFGSYGSAGAMALVEKIKDRHWKVRMRAFDALGKMGSKGVVALPVLLKAAKDRRRWMRNGALKALSGLGLHLPPVQKAIEEALQSRRWKTRKYIVKLLAERGQKGDATKALALLMKASQDRKWKIRWEVVWALAKFGPKAASSLPYLLKELTSRKWKIRRETVRTLGSLKLETPKVLSALNKALKDKKWQIRLAAIRVAGGLKKPTKAIRSTLHARTKEYYYKIRRGAAYALGKLGSGSASNMRKLFWHKDSVVQKYSTKKLRQWSVKDPTVLKENVDFIVQPLCQREVERCLKILAPLRQYNKTQLTLLYSRLHRPLKAKKGKLRKIPNMLELELDFSAPKARKKLRLIIPQLLKSPSPGIRMTSIGLWLRLTPKKKQLSFLELRLQDKDKRVRELALQLITDLKEYGVSYWSKTLLANDSKKRALALTRLERLGSNALKALPALLKASKNKSKFNKSQIKRCRKLIEKMGLLAIPFWKGMLAKENPRVERVYAITVMSRLYEKKPKLFAPIVYPMLFEQNPTLQKELSFLLKVLPPSTKRIPLLAQRLKLAPPGQLHTVFQAVKQYKYQDIRIARALVRSLLLRNHRGSAARLLGKMGPVAYPVMTSFFKKTYPTLSEDNGKVDANKKAAHAQKVKELVGAKQLLLEQLQAQGTKALKMVSAVSALLNEQDIDLQVDAMKTLRRIHPAPEKFVASFAKLAQKGPQKVRVSAIRQLAFLGPKAKSALPVLTRLAKDKVAKIRAEALLAIGQTKVASPKLFTLVSNACYDFQSSVRVAAVSALPPHGKKALSLLGRLLQHQDAAVRIASGYSLQKLGKHALPLLPALNQVVQTRYGMEAQAVQAAIAGIAADSSVALLGTLLKRDVPLQLLALRYLQKNGVKASAVHTTIQKGIDSKNLQVRQQTIQTLLAIGPKGRKHLTDALQHKDLKVRLLVLGALEKQGTKVRWAGQALVARAKDKENIVRESVLSALERILPGSGVSLQVLLQAFQDKDPSVRARAFSLLQKRRVKSPQIWLKALESKDAKLWLKAVSSLYKHLRAIKYDSVRLTPFKKSYPAFARKLAPLLSQQKTTYQLSALLALQQMGKAAAHLHGKVAPLLKSKSAYIRSATIELLLLMGPTALPSLIKGAQSSHLDIRLAALGAITKLRPKDTSANASVFQALKDKNLRLQSAAVEALSVLPVPNSKKISLMMALLSSKQKKLHKAALKVLGTCQLKDKKWLKILQPFLQSKDKAFRHRAVRVLGRYTPLDDALKKQLFTILEDKEQSVGKVAYNALNKLDVTLSPLAVAGLSHKNKNVRYFSAKLLQKWPAQTETHLVTLHLLLGDEAHTVKVVSQILMRHFPLVLGTLLKTLRGDNKIPKPFDASIEGNISKLLGSLKTSAHVALFLQACKKPENAKNRTKVLKILKQIGPKHSGVLAFFVSHLTSSDQDERWYAIHTLGHFGSAAKSTLPALLKVIDDPKWYVSEAVVRTIREISGRSFIELLKASKKKR